ncbi:hypothetical protein D3C81_1611220 [compost metagenome]
MAWHTPETRLEAEHAARRRRGTDGPAAIAGDMQHAHPQRRGNGSSATAAAGRAARVPRIARDAGKPAFGEALCAKLGGIGLAQQHGPVLAQACRCRTVFRLRRITGGKTSHARWPALHMEQVLEGHRHAIERPTGTRARPACFGCACLLARAIRIHMPEGVDHGIEPRHAVEHGVQHLDG